MLVAFKERRRLIPWQSHCITYHPFVMHWSNGSVILFHYIFHRASSLLSVSDYSSHKSNISIGVLPGRNHCVRNKRRPATASTHFCRAYHEYLYIHLSSQVGIGKYKNPFDNNDFFGLHVDAHICPAMCREIIRRNAYVFAPLQSLQVMQ